MFFQGRELYAGKVLPHEFVQLYLIPVYIEWPCDDEAYDLASVKAGADKSIPFFSDPKG